MGTGVFKYWVENIILYMVALFGMLLLLVAVFVAFVLLRAYLRQKKIKRLQNEDYLATIGPNGKPYPPSDRGICHSCQEAFEKVYFLPSGQRLCQSCYEKFLTD